MENETNFERTKNMVIIILVGMLVVISALLMSILFQFGIIENLVMSWILTTGYAIFGLVMIKPEIRINPLQIIDRPVIQEVLRFVDRPVIQEVIREVPIQIPIENKTIEVVDRPVIQEVIREVPVEVEKRVVRYIQRKPKHLNIPQFKFVGSVKARKYHKRTCKFSKLIKRKYKTHSNTKATFKRKHFKACKTCLKK